MTKTLRKSLFLSGAFLLAAISFCLIADSQRSVQLQPRVYGSVDGARMVPTHIFFDTFNSVEIISDFRNNRLLFRNLSEEGRRSAWAVSSIESLRGPHAIAYHPVAKQYFVVDTANNQVVSFASLDNSDSEITRYSELAGVAVGKRPHDIVYNPVDGFLYVVNGSGVLRFMPDVDGIRQAKFLSRNQITRKLQAANPGRKVAIGYMRSITIVDGIVYLINSTMGSVVEIGDFDDLSSWTVRTNKDRPPKYAEAGEFDKDGLILNDVDYYRGYWYATNYYPSKKHNYLGSKNNLKNKIIRWRTWDDFHNSKWEDLSSLAHPESIPYYFSKYDGRLFLSMFHIGNEEGLGSGIYEFDNGYF